MTRITVRALAGRRWPMALVLIGACLWVLGRVGRSTSGAGDGLAAEYFSNPAWTGPPALRVADRDISTAQMRRRWNGRAPDQFSVRWSGYLAVPEDGVYAFALRSDDGSSLFVDGQLVVDNRGMHSARARTGRVQLARGSHAVRLEYTQFAGAMAMEWSWSTDGAAPRLVPGYALSRQPAAPAAVVAVRLSDDLASMALVVLALGMFWWALVDVPRVGAAIAGSVRRRHDSRLGFAVSAATLAAFFLLPEPGNGMFVTSVRTLGEITSSAVVNVRRFRQFQKDLETPRSGEAAAIPESVRAMVTVLDRDGLATYRLSASIVANDWVYQQMIATAWPRTLEPDARALFILAGEPVPPGCTPTDTEADISLVSCP